MLRPWARRVRPDQLPVVDRAVALLVVANAAAGLASAAADALFLAHVGATYLGWALAGSSLLVIAVLAIVGAAADRVDRARVLGVVAGVGAIAVAAVAVLAIAAPDVAGAIAIVLAKQVQSAVDLVIWVVLAERFDARQSARLVPVWAAAAGVGSALGSLAAWPISYVAGAPAVLGASALVWVALAAIPIGGAGRIAPTGRGRVAWTEGARAVARSPLARRLAILVAVAGCFGSLAYYVLGATAAADIGGADDLVGFLGRFRGVVQVITLVVQLVIAPRLLARAGVATALVIAPVVALAAGLGLVGATTLLAAVILQGQARLLDTSIEAPAEKLAQNLFPVGMRGRIAGFLDGAAKRLGAVTGALIAGVLTNAPRAFAIVTVVTAAVWSIVAFALGRRLPSLAVAALTAAPERERELDAEDPLAAVSDAVIAALVAELGGDDAGRAAELLARLHARGRTDAIAPLARAVSVAHARQRVAIARALADAAETRVPDRRAASRAIEAAIGAAPDDDRVREALVRALGLAAPAGDADAHAALARIATAPGPLASAAEIARSRLGADPAAAHAAVDEAIEVALDDDDPEVRAAGTRDLRAELSRHLDSAPERAIDCAHRLLRLARKRRVDEHTRAQAMDALAAALGRLGAARSASHVLLKSELTALARELADRREPAELAPAPVAAAALRLLAALPDEPADDAARLYAAALGDLDEEVRDSAEAGLRALGPAAIGELVRVADFGRRVARDRAARLLGELPVTSVELDRMLDAELALLDATCVHLHVLAPEGGLLARRLEERAREIAHTVLLLVAARQRSRPVASAARVFRAAPDPGTRARALAVLDTALPRPMVARLLDAVDELPAAERARAAAARMDAAPDRDRAIQAEVGGGDRLARALVLHTLDAGARASHRATISSAAASAAAAASPLALLRRIADAEAEEDRDVPTRVETMLILGDVPLLAALTARQLADLAGKAAWKSARAGDTVANAGESLDALIVVADGELALGDDRVIARGQAVDELAWFAPAPLAAPLVAARATRYLRIERLDFDELVDDVPGLGASVLRVLGTRARR
ncbi:MAG TPA: hypothetical protein VL463_18215 [Kofleriaceae bacterium]|nr:hypothetical protein [Kofleriaceae bacterium]